MYPSPKQQQTRLVIVALLCLTGALTAAYLLYQDMGALGGARNGKVLAQVEKAVASVKRKASTSFLWTRVEEGNDLFLKDSVQVGANSQAVIRLNDDSLLEIGEHSLVIIEDVPPLEMKFVKGSFIVRGKTQDHKITAKKNQAPTIEPIPLRLKTPAPLHTFFERRNAPTKVVFSWEPSEAGNDLKRNINPVLELSTEGNFPRRMTKVLSLANNTTNSMALDLPLGEYFWRIRAKNLNVFETRSFTIAKAAAPKLVSPTSNQLISRWEKVAPVEFRWLPSENDVFPTWIQVAKSAQFQKATIFTTKEIDVKAGKIQIENVPSGKYYWRLITRYPEFAVSSPRESFSILRKNNIPLVLKTPKEQETLPTNKSIIFAWGFDSDDMNYALKVEKVTGKSDPEEILSKTVSERELSWLPPQAGQYRWKVSVLWKEEMVSTSKWQSFFVKDPSPLVLTSPPNNSKHYYWNEPKVVSLGWQHEALVTQSKMRYQVTAARDSGLRRGRRVFLTRQNSTNTKELKLGKGKFYWQVKVVDAADRTLKESAIQVFETNTYPQLAAPGRATPSPNAVINVVKLDKDVETEWEPIANAVGYEFVLENNAGRSLASVRTKTPKHELKDIKPGEYYWRARAIDPLNRGGKWLPKRKLTISYGERLQAPEIIGSEVE